MLRLEAATNQPDQHSPRHLHDVFEVLQPAFEVGPKARNAYPRPCWIRWWE
jgi:hypothetical protein